MFKLARQLRVGCRIGILTDTKLDRIRRLRSVQGLDDLFDPILVSAECGLSKSSPAFFEHALAIVASDAAQTLLIDNDGGNIAVAVSCGLHAIHFDDTTNDVAGLRATLRSRFGTFL
jgi:putative hydrolase of the HAD superfamily